MTNKYDFSAIEEKWADKWETQGIYRARDDSEKKPVYVLGMFPYPSGDGLHCGHVRIYTACDVMARFLRMKGYEVMLPMGWDAFGLPAENAAIKAKVNPMQLVPKNEANFKRQMQMMGLSYDWSREFSTTDPKYYKWTQWLFLQLYNKKNEKGERLVYREEVPINWCPFCKTGLANEEVLGDGTHERCGKQVSKKMLPQWVMRITDYADELLKELDTVEWSDEDGKQHVGLDWPKGILEMQKNWIGRKEGVKIGFRVQGIGFGDKEVEVFTTRVDTVFGVTFMVVAPELVGDWIGSGWEAPSEVKEYVNKALSKTEEQRMVEEKEKTGVDTGLKAVNPVNGEEVSVFVADYVLANFGTGAVMGVPAHDERDFAFAKKFGMNIKTVVSNGEGGELFVDYGRLLCSGEFDGLTSEEAMDKIPEKYAEVMEKSVSYHLRDWVFSRQRYWGEPFPLVYCDKCGDENGVVTVPEDQLPIELPPLQSYEPTDTGESPLSRASDWVETTCPKCGGKARRETDTMPNWAGSCWYFLRFPSQAQPGSDASAWIKECNDKWLPVPWYLGGAEHAVLHLLYARFWVKVFNDLDLLDFREPFLRLRSVGMVLAEDGKKMSKSLGNVINPDGEVKAYGADALRLYEMFMGPWDQQISWDTRSLVGCSRFVRKIYDLVQKSLEDNKAITSSKLNSLLHRTVKKAGEDIAELKFNTAIASIMEFINAWEDDNNLGKEELGVFIRLLAPFAPFLAEELYQGIGTSSSAFAMTDVLAGRDRGQGTEEYKSVHMQRWPEYDPELVRGDFVVFAVQVNGKLRGTIGIRGQAPKGSLWELGDRDLIEKMAREDEKISKWIANTEIKKVIFIPPRENGQGLINFVV